MFCSHVQITMYGKFWSLWSFRHNDGDNWEWMWQKIPWDWELQGLELNPLYLQHIQLLKYPIPPAALPHKNVTWRYLRNQAWYRRSADNWVNVAENPMRPRVAGVGISLSLSSAHTWYLSQSLWLRLWRKCVSDGYRMQFLLGLLVWRVDKVSFEETWNWIHPQ